MQIVLKTKKGPVALPRWMPLLLLVELVWLVLVCTRGLGAAVETTFSPAQLTNQYTDTLTLQTGADGSVTPDPVKTTLFDTLEPKAEDDETPPPSLLVSDAFALPAGRYLVTVEYAAGQDAQLQMLPESADIIDMNVTLPATNAETSSVTRRLPLMISGT